MITVGIFDEFEDMAFKFVHKRTLLLGRNEFDSLTQEVVDRLDRPHDRDQTPGERTF